MHTSNRSAAEKEAPARLNEGPGATASILGDNTLASSASSAEGVGTELGVPFFSGSLLFLLSSMAISSRCWSLVYQHANAQLMLPRDAIRLSMAIWHRAVLELGVECGLSCRAAKQELPSSYDAGTVMPR
jgi:hypothetical protein